jgi:hypothetical protein
MPLKAVAAILGVNVRYAYNVIYSWKRAGYVLQLDRRGLFSNSKKFDDDIVV